MATTGGRRSKQCDKNNTRMCRVTRAGRTNNNNNNNNEAHTHTHTYSQYTHWYTHCGCVKGVLRFVLRVCVCEYVRVYRFLLVFCGVMLTKASKQVESREGEGGHGRCTGLRVGSEVLTHT